MNDIAAIVNACNSNGTVVVSAIVNCGSSVTWIVEWADALTW